MALDEKKRSINHKQTPWESLLESTSTSTLKKV